MTYLLTIPRNAGNKARKAATASRRALVTACACDAGRIGMMEDKDSSFASISAISRNRASPFFVPLTDRNAQRKTRNSTRTAVGSGSSLGGAKFGFNTTRTPVVSSRIEAKHAKRRSFKFNVSFTVWRSAAPNCGLSYSQACCTRARDAGAA